MIKLAGAVPFLGTFGAAPLPDRVAASLRLAAKVRIVLLAVAFLWLAITMVSVGVAAAWGVQHASKRINFSDRLIQRLPLASAGLVGVLGVIMLVQGFVDLAAPATALS